MLRTRIFLCFVLASVLCVSQSYSLLKQKFTGKRVSSVASDLVETMTAEQKQIALYAFDSEKRLDWHFIPIPERKGLKIRNMTEQQQQVSHQLLRMLLSESGYYKTTRIMALETLLFELESPEGRERRDSLKYYVTLFGDPTGTERWGISFEGHHLSLNFTLEGNQIISSTPQFFAANPATIKTENSSGFAKGDAVLRREAGLGFRLINALDAKQQKVAIVAEKPLKEIRNAGEPHPAQEAAQGIAWNDLNADQQKLLKTLIYEYISAAPSEVRAERIAEIDADGWDKIQFAWQGATKPGEPHYYCIQGKNFVIEYANTQPDVAGNPANHIHAVWRDLSGDFGIDL